MAKEGFSPSSSVFALMLDSLDTKEQDSPILKFVRKWAPKYSKPGKWFKELVLSTVEFLINGLEIVYWVFKVHFLIYHMVCIHCFMLN
ncbi:hypothetical protein CASFOL_003647 [Castilleja foliolosa]|uniref:Uncharacterized protein n=1 Tax=Castilleja foliolosa TaxID=1961234 RepID=A0ABD3EL27_9LAMI